MRKEFEITYQEKINQAVNHLKKELNETPRVGIILGTGLGSLLNEIEIITEIQYEEIPHFPISTVTSHPGKLILGRVAGRYILAMKGRFHYYEGYTMKEVTFPIRVMKKLGIQSLLISNASGGLNPDYRIGDVMVINDHIDLFPENPLRGPNMEEFGDRFPDMSEAYHRQMIKWTLEIAGQSNITIRNGVYAGVQGPNLETPAEYKYLRTIGADAVGMSTIPEVIVAAHCGLKVFAMSAITDLCTPGNIKKISLPDILKAAAKAEPTMRKIFLELLKKI
jgi:purine-nucleoside phosphorylase